MTDRELLELAAKAAGVEVEFKRGEFQLVGHYRQGWNPLNDDGDAQRLRVALRLSVLWQHDWVMAYRGDATARERDLSDPGAAERRAAVRVAAEIGKDMP